jgi:hypothetical protein
MRSDASKKMRVWWRKAFNRFHELQTQHQMDVDDFRLTPKEELRSRLKKLSTQLDQCLAKGIWNRSEQEKIF